METIKELSLLREHNDHVEFKRALHDFPFTGGSKTDIRERRKCVLGYVVALANERGGRLVLGMEDKYPHTVSGTDFGLNGLGKVEDEIYKRLGIRVKTSEHFTNEGLRVVVFDVPSRPVAKALRFEGIPLMRVGDNLREMDDAEYFNIISEADPDFSARVCDGLTIDDLDEDAVANMRKRLSNKRQRSEVMTVPLSQLLSDLDLLVDGRLNYAALLLLGKKEAIRKYMPQCNVVVEYRLDHVMTRYTSRCEFCGPVFLIVDEIWAYINQPASNPMQHIELWPQISDIPSFNEEVIREAILNSIIHRSLQMNGDILIRQYPDEITISNPGGFPFGVNLGNILTVNSSPRSRRMAEVIEKTGLIERSGQGVDIIFSNSIREGKELPDYSLSDDFQVSLTLKAPIVRPFLHAFIRRYEASVPDADRLSAFDVLTLHNVLNGDVDMVFADSVKKLLAHGLIREDDYFKYVVGDDYFSDLTAVKTGNFTVAEISALYHLLKAQESIGMPDIVKRFADTKTPKQVRLFVEKSTEAGLLNKEGVSRSTRYTAGMCLLPYLKNV